MDGKKQEIIKWIKHFKRVSTSRIGGLLAMDYNSIKKYLEELEKERKIKKEEETNAVYWSLNDESKNNEK